MTSNPSSWILQKEATKMFQLLRAEFYQIRHRVVPFTMLLLSFLATLGIASLATMILFGEKSATSASALTKALVGSQVLSIYTVGLKEIPLILCFVAQILTFNNETKNRTLINTISYGHRRRSVVLSKILVGLFYLLLALCLGLAALVIGGSMSGATFKGDEILGFFTSYLIPSIPLFLGYIALLSIPAFLFAGQGPLIFTYLLLTFINQIISGVYSFLTTNTQNMGNVFQKFLSADKAFAFFFTFLKVGKPLTWGNLNFDLTPVVASAYFLLFFWIAVKLFNRAEVK